MRDKRLNMLAGQIIVVTGGAGLLGRQLAKSILEYGGTPVIADLDYFKKMAFINKTYYNNWRLYDDFVFYKKRPNRFL